MQTPLNILKADLARYESEYKYLFKIFDRLNNELGEIDKKRQKYYEDSKVLQEEIKKLEEELDIKDPNKEQEDDRTILKDIAEAKDATESIKEYYIAIEKLKNQIASEVINISRNEGYIDQYYDFIKSGHRPSMTDKELNKLRDSINTSKLNIVSHKEEISQLETLIKEKNNLIGEFEVANKGQCAKEVLLKRLCELRDTILENNDMLTKLQENYDVINTQLIEITPKLNALTTSIDQVKEKIKTYEEPSNKVKNIHINAKLDSLAIINTCLSVLGEGPTEDYDDNNIMVDTALQCINNSYIKELTKEWWFNTHIRVLMPNKDNNITIKDTTILALYSLDNHASYGIRDDGYVYQYIDGYPTFLFSNPVKVKCVTLLEYEMLPMNAKILFKYSAVLDFQTKYSADGNSSAILASLYADAYTTLHTEHIRHIKCNLLDNQSIRNRRNIIGYR